MPNATARRRRGLVRWPKQTKPPVREHERLLCFGCEAESENETANVSIRSPNEAGGDRPLPVLHAPIRTICLIPQFRRYVVSPISFLALAKGHIGY